MINWFIKNASSIGFGLLSLFFLLIFYQKISFSENDKRINLVNLPQHFSQWAKDPQNQALENFLRKSLRLLPDQKAIYEPMILEVAIAKNNGLCFVKQQESLDRLQRLLPSYALLSRASLASAQNNQQLAIQTLAKIKDKNQEYPLFLQSICLLQLVSLQGKKVDCAFLDALEKNIEKEHEKTQFIEEILGKEHILQYIASLREKTSA